jgi:hypothetical protein
MQTRENNIAKQPVTKDREKAPPRDPLTKAVEDALLNQDIPVETGVRPAGTKRKENP